MATELIPVIRNFITHELLESNVMLDENTLLIEHGHLTSLQTVELVAFLEDQFKITIEPEEVNEEQFRSLTSIAKLVHQKTAS